MICNKCGNQNVENANVCTNCGNILNAQNLANVQPQNTQINSNDTGVVTPVEEKVEVIEPTLSETSASQNQTIQNPTPTPSPVEPAVQSVAQPQTTSVNQLNCDKISFKKFFFIILSFIIKPYTVMKEEFDKFKNFKNSFILSLIITLFTTVIFLLKTIIEIVHVKGYSKSEWQFENLKLIGFSTILKIAFIVFLVYLIIIFAIAFIYYVVGLITKKDVKYPKLVAITAVSTVPLILTTIVFLNFLMSINTTLGIIILLAGILYSIVLIYEGMNEQLQLDGNQKILCNFICLLAVSIALYLILDSSLFSSSIPTSSTSLFSNYSF
ncbi:MAG: YIP1 family protein [Bacilli bacterium]|nr:YIP1 family protein [Bacilli bacterium]